MPDPVPDAGRKVKIGLGIAAVFGACVIGGIGFYLSFGNLSTAGYTVFGFPRDDAPLFAVGVDAAIITCLLLDLFMATIRTSWPLLRLLAHAMTAASVYFNAAAHGAVTENWDKAISHGLMPVLFVVGVEAGRRILVHQAALPADHDVIPARRWVLAPRSTWRIFREMKLWNVGYSVAMARQRERAIFNAWNEYKAELQTAKLEEGSEKALARLPKKLRPFGLTVDEALALPDKMAREELRRKQEADKRNRELELEQARTEHQAEKERLAHRKEMAGIKADLMATEGVAGAQARGAVAAAERQAELEEAALESAVVAEARARAAAAEREEAENRRAAAEADRLAAEEEGRAAEERRKVVAEDRAVQLETQAIETQRAAEARLAAAEANERAAEVEQENAAKLAKAETDRRRAADERQRVAEAEERVAEAKARAAEARRRAAEAEKRAVEAEDLANLTQRQRRVRTVARMLLAAAPSDVELSAIEERLKVATSTASTTKADAVALIQAGYDPASGFDPEAPSRAGTEAS